MQAQQKTQIYLLILSKVVESRMSLSETAFILFVKTLAYAAYNNHIISHVILEYPHALEQLVECLHHPYIEIKVYVSSLLASIKKSIMLKPTRKSNSIIRRKY